MFVMVNGLPGNMATLVAKYIIKQQDMELYWGSLTGEEITEEVLTVGKGEKVTLFKPSERTDMPECFIAHPPDICIDYTHPSAVASNIDFYIQNNLPFVMGTTGVRPELEDKVRRSNISAVIAPNMAKPIVTLQAMMKYAADTFPDAFKGYTLSIVESHQQGKADTSGTAKAMVEYFNRMGIPFTKDQIKMIRKPRVQEAMDVPKEHLKGHGWHTYILESEDKTVHLKFTHNVNGRDVYAAGTIDAVKFLQSKIGEGQKGQVYSMIDVLKGK